MTPQSNGNNRDELRNQIIILENSITDLRAKNLQLVKDNSLLKEQAVDKSFDSLQSSIDRSQKLVEASIPLMRRNSCITPRNSPIQQRRNSSPNTTAKQAVARRVNSSIGRLQQNKAIHEARIVKGAPISHRRNISRTNSTVSKKTTSCPPLPKLDE